MAYTPVNWDETTPVNATNLDKMDIGIKDLDARLNQMDTEIKNLNEISSGNIKIGEVRGGQTTFRNYVKVAEGKIGQGGTCTVKFGLSTSNSSAPAYAQIRINGNIAGLERSTNHTNYNYYTENIVVNSGDNIQVYAKTTNAYANVSGIEVFVNEGLSFGDLP